ncbi:XdhC family protein [Methylocystis sp. MJC1]|uniref:XdhC family protein n=1 Tax=Methylocystis sp. MJC1 TaxID=2654282 RepID=UPI001FF03367|nr:XdhC/CoxI family protein [Methylocystis sp. MJC1]KAF2991009.1 putative xanthine dehydrogenase subunit A [Methylocystis sp. MJC1]UZX12533.1 XdhC family protein [Methylocystis sp. MJC1]
MNETSLSAPVDDASVLRQAESWRRMGRGVALATVVETFGSAPRPVGSHLAVDEAGAFCGSVSAGCVEGEVITAAQDAIADGAPRFLEFGVADEVAWRVGLSCGGRIAVHVERIDPDRLVLLSALNGEIAARRPCAVITPLDGGAMQLIRAGDFAAHPRALPAQLRDGDSGLVLHEGRRLFISHHRPGPRLLVVGAVHVAQALAAIATLAGFDVTVIDPRGAYASAERFPQARLDMRWPDEALPEIGLDAATAIAILTHDPKIDDPALRLALASDCFYVGALGSRATHARRAERLKASGVTPFALERLRAPIGLDIAAISPAEIAVSILAEVILARGQKPLRQLLQHATATSCGAG